MLSGNSWDSDYCSVSAASSFPSLARDSQHKLTLEDFFQSIKMILLSPCLWLLGMLGNQLWGMSWNQGWCWKKQGPLWILLGTRLQGPLHALSAPPPNTAGPVLLSPGPDGLSCAWFMSGVALFWSASKETENMEISTFQPCFPHDAHKVGNSLSRGILMLDCKKRQNTMTTLPKCPAAHQA